MNAFNTPSRKTRQWMIGVMAALMFAASPIAMSQPAQKPLLASSTGAKPNLMIALDNSGSMAYPFHESYGITSDEEYELKYCPSPYSSSSSTTISTFNSGIGGEANYSSGTYTCYVRTCTGFGCSRLRTNVALSYSPVKWGAAKWAAQRSADVNPIYYNPRITYKPRVDANNQPLVPSDGIVFVSNQNSGIFESRSYRNNTDTSLVRSQSTFYAATPNNTGWTQYVWTGNSGKSVPRHETYTAIDANTPGFTYAYCDEVVTVGGLQVDCAQPKTVTIKPGTPATITLPSGHARTDIGCTGNVCTNDAEIKNILNWFRYYGFRAPAVATAIGQALANSDFNNQLRLGYININERSNTTTRANTLTPGVDTGNVGFMRGVRMHSLGSADTQALYTWLYDQDGTINRSSNSGADPTFSTDAARRFIPNGGTPLHNVIDKVAAYYRVGTGATENPWATNPAQLASTSNPEMSCRRSFNLLFSDGAWNAGTTTISGLDYDNTDGNTTTGTFTRTLPNGSTESFRYRRNGINTEAGRKSYVPYPSSATSGLADLAAQYYWHTDLRTALSNDAQTRPGQPAFWQNMTTYTLGYMVRPSGNVQGATSGLTIEQIEKYQTDYAALGYAASTKPSWVTGNVNATTASDQNRVDDFIQAGFTGGGRGFSAQSADDVRDIFNTILADILNAAGRDAGVAVSTDTSDTTTIAGRLKYSVSYKTVDNSGDIVAQELDADGNVVRDTDDLPITKWSAAQKLPAYNLREVFTYSDNDKGTEFKGNFSSLPEDVRASLKYGPDADRVPNDASFVNYLRGLDPVADADGKLFRQRASKLGAMVNPPSIYMGGARDFAYDLSGSVEGSGSYLTYADSKRALPASLLVATNAGVVHNLNATTGDELAAFMPRRSFKRMLNYARDDYTFEYTLDGPLSEHDIYDGTDWNHLAVGTGGRGERLIYALRAPLNGTDATGDRIPEKEDFLWEVGPTKGPQTVGDTSETDTINTSSFALGHMTQPARSGQTENGEWVVVLNSGHHNGFDDGSRHGLLVLNALTGDTIRRIPLPATYSAKRGLSGVTLVRNADKRIVAAYAGDANGNLWRFDLRGEPTSWAVSYDKPMFTTANHRPIYGAPAWQAHPKGGTIVVVATGMLLDETDVGDTAINDAIYGIWDPTVIGEDDESPFTPAEVSDLLVQSVRTGTDQVGILGTFSTTTKASIDWSKHRGWTFALGHTHEGERNIDQIRNVGNSVFINTTVIKAPEDTDAETCSAAGLPLNYLYGLRALDGATQYSFDVDGDGKLDNVSMVLLDNGGFTRGVAFANITKTETTDAIREQDGIDRLSGEAPTEPQKCTNIVKKGIGTEEGALGLGVYCPVSGWSRSQYQLSTPPSN